MFIAIFYVRNDNMISFIRARIGEYRKFIIQPKPFFFIWHILRAQETTLCPVFCLGPLAIGWVTHGIDVHPERPSAWSIFIIIISPKSGKRNSDTSRDLLFN